MDRPLKFHPKSFTFLNYVAYKQTDG